MNAQNLSTEEADRLEVNRQHRANRRYKGEQAIRELHVSHEGRIHTVGDENTPDFDRVVLENMPAAIDPDMEMQSNLRRRQIAAGLVTGSYYGTELALDADEWEEVAAIEQDWMVPTKEYESEFTTLLRDIAKTKEDEEEPDIFAIARAERNARCAKALKSVENHPLVKDYGFTAEDLVVGGRFSRTMNLSAILDACRAANELTRISDDREVAKVLGWTDALPESLAEFGADRLARHSGALKARVKAIRAQHEAAGRKVGGIRPRLALPTRHTPTPKEPTAMTARAPTVATAPQPVSMSSARKLMERINRGLEAAVRLQSHGAAGLLDRALAARFENQALNLVADVERMLRACEATPLPTHRPSTAPRAPAPKPACFGNGSPNTAARKAAQLAKKRATTAKFSCPKGSSNATPQGKGGKKKGKK